MSRTDSSSQGDLPLLAKVVDLAHTCIFTKTQDGITQTPGEDAEDRAKRNRSRNAA